MSETFGRYRLLRVFGEGGMAQVHLAQQIGPQGFVKPCVLKRIAPAFVKEGRYRRMFLQEARLSALLNHPNIVQAFDFGEVDGVPYMALELVDGVNLFVLCSKLADKKRWLPLRAAVEICADVCEALSYAHKLTGLDGLPLNLVHRDVSPQNILLSRQGQVKLADFGIAAHDDRIEVTQSGMSKGKPGYMAPEQAMGSTVDGRTDLYALGIVLTELVSARRVHRVSEPVNPVTIQARVRELCTISSEISTGLVDLAVQLTSLNTAERPRDAREVVDRLRAEAARLPDKDNLPRFLERVFDRYLPAEATSAAQIVDLPPLPPEVLEPSFQLELSDSERREVLRDVWTQMPMVQGPRPAELHAGWPTSIRKAIEGVPALALPPAPAEKTRTPLPAEPLVPEGMDLGLEHTQERAHEALGRLPDPTAGASGIELARPARVQVATRKAAGWFDRLAENLADPRALRAIFAVTGIGIIVALFVFVRALATPEDRVAAPQHGRLTIDSDPPGAAILLNGHAQGAATPHVIDDLPVDVPMRIAVQLAGMVAEPVEETVRLPPEGGGASVHFSFVRARSFRLQSRPPTARVTAEGITIAEDATTPLALPSMKIGATATLTVSADGYFPKRFLLKSGVETATVAEVTLERARKIEINTDPSGARIWIDGVLVGESPIWDVPVPTGGRFTLRAERHGFKPWEKTLESAKLESDRFEISLPDLPLMSMPLNRAERRAAKELERRLAEARAALRAARARLSRAEVELDRVQNSKTPHVRVAAQAHKNVSLARAAVQEHEARQDEASDAVEQFRDDILERLRSDEP